MDKKKISVLMTVYKENEEELRESFESIINQTYKNLEIIVVIDFPDETWRKELIEQYKDTRVKLILNEKNIGLPLSLNKALKVANGDYYARMDADDISTLDRFEKQLEYIEKEDCDLVGSYMQYFYEGKDSLSETSYDEAAVNQIKEKELQEEQAKLEQQQKVEREKLAKKKAIHKKKKAKKKSHKTKKDRKKSSKVSSGRKHKK